MPLQSPTKASQRQYEVRLNTLAIKISYHTSALLETITHIPSHLRFESFRIYRKIQRKLTFQQYHMSEQPSPAPTPESLPRGVCNCELWPKDFSVPSYAVRKTYDHKSALIRLQGHSDVILIAKCGRHLALHKAVLSVNSELFNGLFEGSSPSTDDVFEGLPLIRMEESCQVLALTLKYCYNIP